MKIYTVFYNEHIGNINYVLIRARNERSARNEFNRDYRRYKIITVEETIL